MFQSFGGWFCIVVLGLIVSLTLSGFKKNSWTISALVWVCLVIIFQADYYLGYFKYRSLCENKAGIEIVKQAVIPAGIEVKSISRPERAKKYLDMGFGYVRGNGGVIFESVGFDGKIVPSDELITEFDKVLLARNIFEYRLVWRVATDRVYEKVSYSYSGGWIDDFFSSYSLNHIENCNSNVDVSYSSVFEGIQ